MRLEMADYRVKETTFGKQTRYLNGTLEISREELKGLVLGDHRIKGVSFELVAPNEDCRITGVCDVIEPRVKVEGPGVVFPGIMGPVETVGSGRTHRISNMCVVPSAEVPSKTRASTAPRGGIMDMAGPGAARPMSDCYAVVVLLELEEGWSDLDYHETIQMAEMKVGKRLAEATIGQKPTEVKVYELTPCDPALPRVVLLQSFVTTAHAFHPGKYLYGFPVREAFPTVIHPNELFDGIVTHRAVGVSGFQPVTWHWMNNACAFGLYQDHGVRFNFIGVILQRIRFETHKFKEMTANMTANMAKLMGAQGAVVAMTGTGFNAFIDTMLTVGALEKQGIQTVFIAGEGGGATGKELPLLYYVPEAVSMISAGSGEQPIKLPKVKRVVGPTQVYIDKVPNAPLFDAYGEIEVAPRYHPFVAGLDTLGSRDDICLEY